MNADRTSKTDRSNKTGECCEANKTQPNSS